MNKINFLKIIPLIFLFLLSACSYQKMNSTNQKKFYIQKFEVSGDTRELFIIQKKIQRFSNKESNNRIKILIKLTKNRSIQRKEHSKQSNKV